MSEDKIINLCPVNDVYVVYCQEEDGSYFAEKVPLLGLCANGRIVPVVPSVYEFSPLFSFEAYGTRESLKEDFSQDEKLIFQGDAKKPVYQDNTSDCPHTAPYCPECGHILIDGNGDNFNYCPDCGQKIDWKETQ